MIYDFKNRALKAAKSVLPGSLSSCIWILKLTLSVSFGVMLLEYFDILPHISEFLEPLFSYLGLPGSSALAFVSGYFVNVYSAISIAVTLDLDARELTILSAMVLCAHNMLVETAVQNKTGTSSLRIVITRTVSAIVLGLVLNLIMPETSKILKLQEITFVEPSFWEMLKEWLIKSSKLVFKMTTVIFALNILQALLAEFGVIRILAKAFAPLMRVFGLPPKASLLWIIANFVGLAYGAAAMIEESRKGIISKKEINETNIHISIAHSNVEDLLLLSTLGGIWWILLLSRWIMALILVYLYKLELMIRKKY